MGERFSTFTPWEHRGNDVFETFKSRNWNRSIAKFTYEADAKRSVDCVNALQGIRKPKEFMEKLKELLTEEQFKELAK